MNEQAIQDAYTLFQKSGYKKDINQFKQLIATNPNALNDAYTLFQKSGYKKDVNSFSDLMGLKKKESSQPTSQQKQQASSAQQKPQRISVATGQQQNQQASAGLNGEPTEKDYFTGGFGNFLRGVDNIIPLGIGDFVDDMARSVSSGYNQGKFGEAADKLLLKGHKSTPEQIQNFIDANKNAQQAVPSDEMKNYQKIYEEEGKGFWGVVKGISKNPSIVPEVMVSSLVSMATNTDALKAGAAAIGTGAVVGGTSGAAAGSAVPGLGTLAGGLAGAKAGAVSAVPYAFGIASSVVEAGSTFGELLTEELNGSELTKENVKSILEDPKKLQSIRNKAIVRGIVIGTIDLLTGKLASGVGAKIIGKSAAKSATGSITKSAVVKATATGGAIESLGGAAGEATARAAIGQDMDVSEIALEAIGELPGGVRSTIQARFAKPSYKVNGGNASAEDIDNMINTMTPEELSSAKIEIKNDYEGREFKIKDKILTNSVKQEVKKANPSLNEATLNAVTDLEKQLKSIEGNNTQTAKDKASELKQKIKDIQINQLPEVTAPVVEEKNGTFYVTNKEGITKGYQTKEEAETSIKTLGIPDQVSQPVEIKTEPTTPTTETRSGLDLPKVRDEVNNSPVTDRDKNNQDLKRFIPFSIIEAANKNDKLGGQTAREIVQRGGYSVLELNRLLPNWKEMLPGAKQVEAKPEIILSGLNQGFTAVSRNSFDVRGSRNVMEKIEKGESFSEIVDREGKKYVVVGLRLGTERDSNVSGRDNYSFAVSEYNENTPTDIVKTLEDSAKENFKNIYRDFTDKDVVKPITIENPELTTLKNKPTTQTKTTNEPSIVVHATADERGFALNYSEGTDKANVTTPEDPRGFPQNATPEQRQEFGKGNAVITKNEVSENGDKNISFVSEIQDTGGRAGGTVFDFVIPKGNESTAERIKSVYDEASKGLKGKELVKETVKKVKEYIDSNKPKVETEVVPRKKAEVSGVEITYPTEEEAETRKQERTSSEYVNKTAELLPEENVENIKKELDGDFGLLTAENPMAQPLTEAENTKLNQKAEKWLRDRGYEPRKVTGKYDQAENSFFVPKLTKEDAIAFAKEFNQESVAHSEGLIYQDGSINPRVKAEDNFSFEDYSPESNYVSVVKTKDGLKTFSVGYDFETKISPKESKSETKPTDQVDALKDIESTYNALNKFLVPSEKEKNVLVPSKEINDLYKLVKNKFIKELKASIKNKGYYSKRQIISEAYHKAKEDGSNPELVKKVEGLLAPKSDVDTELEAITKLFDESEQGGKVTDKQIENGKKAIKKLIPSVEWVIHDTNESMREATGNVNKGEYIVTRDKDGNVKKVIHINKASADGTTVAHEVFHAILIEKVLNDADAQDITRRMMKAVAKTASPKLKRDLDEFARKYPENIRNEERIAQLIGILAKNYDQLSQPNKTIIKKWLDKLANMFGLKPFTDNEVIDLLNTIAGKTARGETITEDDINVLGYGSVEIKKDIRRESKFIDSLVFNRFPTNKNTKVLENFDISSIDGQVAASTLSDKLTAGELKKYKTVGGKKVLESVYTFFGGIGYPEVTGRVWAASTLSGVKKIIDDMKISSDGYRYLIPAVMSNVSHMSNKNMTSITMEVFKEAINNNELNRTKFKEIVSKAFDNKKTREFKEGALEAISGNISGNKMADNLRDYILSSKMTFDSRKDLLQSMVGNPESGNPKFSTVGTFLSLAKSLSDPIAKDADLHQVPVIIRTKGNLTPVKTDNNDEFYHESYGYHIESDQEIEVLHLDGIYNLTDIIPEFTNENGNTVSTEKELKEKGAIGWDIKRILTNLGRTHGISKYSAKIVSKKSQDVAVTKRSQVGSNTIADYVRIAKANNFSDEAIKKFLKSNGFSDTEIDAAMSARTTGTGRPSVNNIYNQSKKAIEDRKKRASIKDLLPYLRKSLLDRQAYIKRLINRIDNKSAKKAYDLLVTKAGASALASERFKRAEKEIYGGLSSQDLTTLDKMIYAKRIIAVNENRAKLGMEPYTGMDGYSLDDARQDLTDFKTLLGEDKYNDLSNRATSYFDVFKKNLKKLYDSGRISKEVYESLKDTEYSPIKTIKYIIGDNLTIDEIDTQAKSLGISRKDIMKLSDSNENEIILDSKWLLAMNISSVEGRAFENNMLREFDRAINAATPEEKKALEDFILDNPVVGTKKDGGPKYKYDDTKTPPGFVKVSYFNDGNKREIVIKDEYAKQLLDVKNKNKALETLGALTGTKILRFFATGGNPLFIIGNTAVDFQNIAFFSDVYSKFKPLATVQLIRDYTKNFIKKIVVSNQYNKVFNEYINHGGALDYMASDGLRALESMNPIKGVTKAAQRGLIAYGRAMAFLGETSEVAFRLSVYDKVKNDSIKEFKKENNREPNEQELDDIMWNAARESRETMDFSQGGDVAKNIDAVFPYFNAALQGIRRPIDFAKKDPVGFSSSVLQYTAMAASLAAGSFAMLIKAVRDDDDDDKEANKKIIEALNSLSEYEKANYHVIFTGNKDKDGEYEYYRVKKLPVLSVISTVAEQLIYKAFFNTEGVDYDVDSEAMMEAVSKSNPLPVTVQEVAAKNPIASGLVSYWANKDTFTGEKIFREPNNKKIMPEAEGMFDDRVSQIYKDLAPGFGLSPARTQVMFEKVITSGNTNPTIPLIYSAYDGIFNNNDGLGEEVKGAMSSVGDAFGKKVVRYTDKNVIRYKEQDKMEFQESVMETDIWKKEQKVYDEIRGRYEDGDPMTTKELIGIVKENFEPMDHKKYVKKYNAYIHNMNIDKSVLDIIFEDVPEVQAMKLNQRYGDNLEGEELKELYKAMGSAGKRVNKKAIYIYNQKYKNRKD